jgi:hypothetical protein
MLVILSFGAVGGGGDLGVSSQFGPVAVWLDLYVFFRVGQNHIYTVYVRYFWQGKHQIYGHIRCIYMVLANPSHELAGCEHVLSSDLFLGHFKQSVTCCLARRQIFTPLLTSVPPGIQLFSSAHIPFG